jgi:hypothetical protein
MRAETELIKKIQGLKGIEPRKDWVILTKKQILAQEFAPEANPQSLPFWGVFQLKYALASLLVILVLGSGAFAFAQKALPGDLLYAVKRAVEKTRLSLVPKEERPNLQLEYANERLENLVAVVQANQARKLAPIIEEYQASVLEAAKGLSQADKLDVKEIAQRAKKIEENKQKVEALGVVVGETEELDNVLAQIVEGEIINLEERSLSETQEELLRQAKGDFQQGNYSQALEKILFLSYPQER